MKAFIVVIDRLSLALLYHILQENGGKKISQMHFPCCRDPGHFVIIKVQSEG